MSNSEQDAFLEKFAPIAFNLALRLTGKPADAEDLAQDALLRALRGLSSFRGDAELSTWFYRIVVNTWKNRVRSEKRRGFWKTISLHWLNFDHEEEEMQFKADDPPLDTGMETDERNNAVQAALLELDDDSRAILLLREIEGRSYDEISSALDIPQGTVKSRISRARAALKLRLKQYL